IPSKSLRHVVKQIIRFRNSSIFREISDSKHLTFPAVLRQAKLVIPKQVDLHTNFLIRNRVKVHVGRASFIDANTVSLLLNDGGREVLHAKDFVVATGSRPYRPLDVDFSHPRIYDSDTILQLEHTP